MPGVTGSELRGDPMLFLLRVRELSSVTMPKVQVSSLGLSVCTHVKWKVVLGWNVLLGVSDKLGCSVLRLWLKAPPHGGGLLKTTGLQDPCLETGVGFCCQTLAWKPLLSSLQEADPREIPSNTSYPPQVPRTYTHTKLFSMSIPRQPSSSRAHCPSYSDC